MLYSSYQIQGGLKMGLKDQWVKIKENWLMIILVLLILGAFLVVSKAVDSTSFGTGYGGVYMNKALSSYDGVSESRTMAPYLGESFAPGVMERKLIKSGNLNSEVEQGGFFEAETKLKAIITSSGAYLLDENVQKYGNENPYHYGYYNLKVDTKKYAAVVSQLKEIGTVTSFSENTQDVTGSYTNLKVELQAEQERLVRYQKMFEEATEVSDKITLNDRIFDEERTIKYLQERLQNVDNEVEYSSIYVSLQEKQSPYANVEFISFSALVMAFVDSLSGLFRWIVVILPYAVVLVIAWVVYKVLRKKKK
jgi:drug/metabolite transporter superfamily protein YnfA